VFSKGSLDQSVFTVDVGDHSHLLDHGSHSATILKARGELYFFWMVSQTICEK